MVERVKSVDLCQSCVIKQQNHEAAWVDATYCLCHFLVDYWLGKCGCRNLAGCKVIQCSLISLKRET